MVEEEMLQVTEGRTVLCLRHVETGDYPDTVLGRRFSVSALMILSVPQHPHQADSQPLSKIVFDECPEPDPRVGYDVRASRGSFKVQRLERRRAGRHARSTILSRHVEAADASRSAIRPVNDTL
jgi:hypothetical protein